MTRYYSDLLEGTDGQLTKYYFLGGLRVASQRVNSSQYAALSPDAAIQVAAVPAGHAAAVVLVLRRDVQFGLMVAVCVVGTGLLLAPWRRKRVVGIAVRHGHVIGVIIAFTVVTLPWPLALRPLGPGIAEAQVLTPIMHYHVDHLGSTQLVTNANGAVYKHIRYKPYGEPRGHYWADGTLKSPNDCSGDRYCHEFTGYDTEPISGLEYAGARVYDPALGMFLTHDPARQFANPYAYGPWNPINGTDPTGTFFVELAIGLIIASVIASGVEAGIRTGDPMEGFNAALTSAAMAGVSPVGLGVVMYGVGVVAGATGQLALSAALVGMGGYNTYEGFKHGQYATAALGVVSTALGVYGLYDNFQNIGAQPAKAETGLQGTAADGEKVTVLVEEPDPNSPTKLERRGLSGHSGLAVSEDYWDYGPQPGQGGNLMGSEGRPWWDAFANPNGDASLSDIRDFVHAKGMNVESFSTHATAGQAAAIREYWQGLYNDPGTYHFALKNCTTTVSDSLRGAGLINFNAVRPSALGEGLRGLGWQEERF
ncbi:MAG: RHS repeat-associated core domain-containing protein [Candidatus Binatia bacterium]